MFRPETYIPRKTTPEAQAEATERAELALLEGIDPRSHHTISPEFIAEAERRDREERIYSLLRLITNPTVDLHKES